MSSLYKRYARVALALFVAVLLLAAFSGSAAAAPPTWGSTYHVVQPGETMYSISMHYGVSMWSIACANGIYNLNYIYVGMVLFIPYGYYGACQPNHYPVVYHPQPYPQPQPCDCYYRVQWGDTLYSIANRYGTTQWVLADANHLANPNYIYAGMVLRIPGCN